jgi:hypothetical protein
MGIDLVSRFGRNPEMAAAIAVQSTEHSLVLDDLLQFRHHRQARFLLRQLRVIDLAGGIVEDHNQVIPAFVLEPLMTTPIDVQQHGWQRTPWPALAMHSAFALARDESGSLQRRLYPGVTQITQV